MGWKQESSAAPTFKKLFHTDLEFQFCFLINPYLKNLSGNTWSLHFMELWNMPNVGDIFHCILKSQSRTSITTTTWRTGRQTPADIEDGECMPSLIAFYCIVKFIERTLERRWAWEPRWIWSARIQQYSTMSRHLIRLHCNPLPRPYVKLFLMHVLYCIWLIRRIFTINKIRS